MPAVEAFWKHQVEPVGKTGSRWLHIGLAFSLEMGIFCRDA
jgi:hypothetical protein